jgi:hypothetical protein
MTDSPRHDAYDQPGDDALDASNLAALRDAFQGLRVPPSTPELEATDETTRRTVAWMADAFAALPVPEARPTTARPPAARPGRVLPMLRRGAWVRHAAAAAVLATLTALLALSGGTDQPVRPERPGDVVVAPPATIPGFRPASASGSSSLVAVADDHLELRAGNVRLVLFTDGVNTPPATD